ncbi:receptor-like protein kinase [Pyrus ussuriensis x Pyrus communis]|uniref:Receptor-like protein kinase n=1 Tax=Pyrus ussuriensis x Pyrus communis TaxID=2448454 RepID=A0A5N5GSV8_9ROSA|nr:receptor-like protein kinase [Pyrus ussuriensis x Pyrus communis]
MTLEAHQESDQKVLVEASLQNYPDFVLGLPLKVSWEMVEEMTFGFRTRILADEKSDCAAYEGFWEPVYGSQVMVKRYNTTSGTSTSPGNSRAVIEAEKKAAALSMHHKNILGLAAIEIARGVRYMHEQCPQGPVVHGKLLITTWLNLKQLAKPIPNQKDCFANHLVPQDNRTLIEWARCPLLMRRAFHELDEVWEDVDMHELSTFQCTKSKRQA